MNKCLMLIGVCGAIAGAQTISITGKVTNSSGQALEGVVVQLLASQVKDTTDAAGLYSLSGSGTPTKPLGKPTVINGIRYQNHRFIFQAASSITVSARLYTLNGARVATVYEGLLRPGITAVPYALNELGRTAYLMHLQFGGQSLDYKLLPLGANAFRISEMSTADGMMAKSAAVDWLQAAKTGYASHVEKITTATGVINITMSPVTAPIFGPNVYIFDPATPSATMQTQATNLFKQQETAQFGSGRYAILMKPGQYNLDINVGFYTEVLGLGLVPDSIVVNGAVHAEADWMGGNATCTFWRSAAGICVVPASGTTRWAVSQAAPYRRMHVKGNLEVAPSNGAGCGGFFGDCKIDGNISGWEEQWFSRNSQIVKWSSGGWSFVFVGNASPPTGTWPNPPYTVIPKTPIIREKPYLIIDKSGNYSVMVPDLKRDSTIGVSWANGTIAGTTVPIDQFYIARAGTDNAATINAALDQGKNLLLTPGIYHLEASLKVTRPGTIVLGIGLPSLIPDKATPALEAADVDGLKIGGILVDASTANSANLVVIGEPGSAKNHSADPTSLWDIFCRVGGEFSGSAACMLTINSSNVIVDHTWLWRADHGTGVGWTSNKNANGLIVNGSNVTIYALFVEHTQEYQVLWNGNGGRCYFMQCEFPYDVPNQAAYMAGSINGYASYNIANTVTSFEGWALGAYAFFNRAPVVVDNAFIVPANVPGIKMRNLLTVTLGGNQGTITHIINGQGAAVKPGSAQVARIAAYP